MYILITSSLAPKAFLLNNMNGSPIVHRERRQERKSEEESRGQDERGKQTNEKIKRTASEQPLVSEKTKKL